MTPAEPATQTIDAPEGSDSALPAAYLLAEPARQSAAVVYASPHSGRFYPPDFLERSRLDPHTLRASEDVYVDELFSAAPQHGSPLLQAVYARAYLDVNREAWELDPDMFHDPLPDYVQTKSGRISAGLGTIARVVAAGTAIYAGRLTFADAQHRIAHVYEPYHAAQARLLDRAHQQFGCAVLIDCHSMPSTGSSWGDMPLKSKNVHADFILGDRYGRTCAPEIMDATDSYLSGLGFNVARNAPYSGGYNTIFHGKPAEARHAMQIEINRALYVNEETLERTADFPALRDGLTGLIQRLADIPADSLKVA
ncbi:MAG: N-formylglutamate amidohydrolase [Alphaproteobacteria bacterium]